MDSITEKKEGISIHAPARGASILIAPYLSSGSVFQFTPLREGLQALSAGMISLLLFQFTPLREGLPFVG